MARSKTPATIDLSKPHKLTQILIDQLVCPADKRQSRRGWNGGSGDSNSVAAAAQAGNKEPRANTQHRQKPMRMGMR
jgi:hypothetical protein